MIFLPSPLSAAISSRPSIFARKKEARRYHPLSGRPTEVSGSSSIVFRLQGARTIHWRAIRTSYLLSSFSMITKLELYKDAY
jgi:hypothetical protein